jgi:hypothetical protein
VQQAGAVAVSPEMWPQQHEPQDEREVKRQRRKQSNRESARRSRLRKQVSPKARPFSDENVANRTLGVEIAHFRDVPLGIVARTKYVTYEILSVVHRSRPFSVPVPNLKLHRRSDEPDSPCVWDAGGV